MTVRLPRGAAAPAPPVSAGRARSQVAAPAALERVAKRLRAPATRPAVPADDDDDRRVGADRGPLDLAAAPRPIALELIAGRGHYERVIRAVLAAHTSVWIATANVKELMVEDGRARPGRRRDLRRWS